ncbi:hypothetical protein BV133_3055 [Blastochloris viridis]|uniref:Uncharacterized protein n=1 Tax=Blastochloris viridis TaxID=1079 RepID=A0A182D5M4_BLAVI|nr:hypothetical protein BV133_3055 [Blastochloris viridis]
MRAVGPPDEPDLAEDLRLVVRERPGRPEVWERPFVTDQHNWITGVHTGDRTKHAIMVRPHLADLAFAAARLPPRAWATPAPLSRTGRGAAPTSVRVDLPLEFRGHDRPIAGSRLWR